MRPAESFAYFGTNLVQVSSGSGPYLSHRTNTNSQLRLCSPPVGPPRKKQNLSHPSYHAEATCISGALCGGHRGFPRTISAVEILEFMGMLVF